ncbi:type IV secretion system protein, partial [Erwinia amylovora]|uniref:type IV secretion system protein n=1 Tax=Erwinia amylovora TaxID=552 RepID=UPI00117862DE
MEVNIAQTLFDAINTATRTQLENVSLVMKVMGVVIGGGWIVYILMKSLAWHFMAVRQVIEDFVMTMVKASLIMFMAFNVEWYISTVVPTVTDFPVWLGNTISGSGSVNNNLVDSLISTYLTSVSTLIKAMDVNPITHFKEVLYGVA